MSSYEFFDCEESVVQLFDRIAAECSQFLTATDQPIFKNLPVDTQPLTKVKVRLHKRTNDFIATFNDAMHDVCRFPKLHQRSVLVNGESSFVRQEGSTPFYIFPVNGFKFAYNQQIKQLNCELASTFVDLYTQCGPSGGDIVKELILRTYRQTELTDGINEGSEIILYNISHYFAISTETYRTYSDILASLRGKIPSQQ